MATGYVIADTANNAGSLDYIDTNRTLAPGILGTISNVDLKTVAQTTLYTVPSTSNGCIITDVMLLISASDTATVGPTVSVGVSPSYNEWIGSTALTTLTSLFKVKSLNDTATGREPVGFAPDQVIKLDITSGATATSLRATIVILGFNL